MARVYAHNGKWGVCENKGEGERDTERDLITQQQQQQWLLPCTWLG